MGPGADPLRAGSQNEWMTMRVYELAKKLGMENKELIPELKRLGVAVASHSSALDEPTVKKVLEQLTSKGAATR